MAGLPAPKTEYRAIPERRFRWDMAFRESLILVEIQGGTWAKGGHSTGLGITRDAEKANLATLNGWRLLFFTTEMVRDGRALKTIQQALETFPPF